jgi:hypothetical protein
MARSLTPAVLAICLIALGAAGACRRSPQQSGKTASADFAPAKASPAPGPPPQAAAQPPTAALSSADAAALRGFEARVKEYAALHQKLERTLPKLSKDSTPQQIDSHQRALARLVQQARAGATPGSIFTPDVQEVVHSLMAQVFGGPDGAALKSSIMDENPAGIKVTVNGRYPDIVPLSTVPPQVLEGLPALPDDLEFRFIGRRLILMDDHAHLVVDFVENALPR